MPKFYKLPDFIIANQQVYFFAHPDAIRVVLVTQQHKFKKSRMLERARVLLGDGLLTSEGQHHLRQRRLVQPAFHRDRLIGYSQTMVARALAARERWEDDAQIDMAREMRLSTVAEGVETLAECQTLADMGCDIVQGYLISKPLEAAAFGEWRQARQDKAQA